MEKWRSPEASEYRKLYQTKQWSVLRRRVLLRDGFRCQHKNCGAMLKRGRTDARSAVVHHIVAHKGDLDLFFDYNNLQAVCWSCHSGDIQQAEHYGFDLSIGDDGWPIDPRHRGNSGFDMPMVVPELTDIGVLAKVSGGTGAISVDMEVIFLEAESYP